jgi:RHS repeat-associated protein
MRESGGGVPGALLLSGGGRVVEHSGRVDWRRFVVFAALLVLLVAAIIDGGVSPDRSWVAGRAASSPAAGQRSSLAMPSALSAAVGADMGAYRVKSYGEAFNPAQGLDLRFRESSGVLVASGAVHVGLRLERAGYGNALAEVGPARRRLQANRVSYSRHGLVEWYANGPSGLEQGFTIPSAPRRRVVGPLTLSLGVFGNAHAALAGPPATVTFSQRGSSLRYGDLEAYDARGRALRSWFVLRGSQLLIRVDVAGARYPVRIDPMIEQGGEITGTGETGAGLFGESVAISSSGTTAIVGAPNDNSVVGAVWIFTRSGLTWTQQGEKLTGGGEEGKASFGESVAISSSGNTALIGATGAAWVFTRTEGKWTQQAEFTSSEHALSAQVALSGEGNTALVGGFESEAVSIFTFAEGKWTAGESLKPTEATKGSEFGSSLALSGDGNTALVGGDRNAAKHAHQGAAWVFLKTGGGWKQQGEALLPFDEAAEDEPEFGYSVALSNNGNTALVGGPNDRGASGESDGAAWVFTREGSSWSKQEKLNSISPKYGEKVGNSVALSANGNTALVGAWGYGVKGTSYGAFYTFNRSGTIWTEQGPPVIGTKSDGSGYLGYSVALSGGGKTAFVGDTFLNGADGAAFAYTYLYSPEEEYGIPHPAMPNKAGCFLGHPVNCATGNQVVAQTDLSVGGRGPGLHATRTYNSLLAATQTTDELPPGPFGYGWTGPYGAELEINEEAQTAIVREETGRIVPFAKSGEGYVPEAPLVQATLVKEGTGYVYTLPSQTTLDFNSKGQLTKEVDRDGNAVNLSYNAEGLLEAVTDAAGRKLTFAYNGEGEVESIKDPMGHTVKYTYESKNLISVTQPGETALRWQFKYNSMHELTSETDGRGGTVTTEYDSAFRVYSQTDAMKRTRKWKYGRSEAGEATTEITEPTGAITLETFNSDALPTSITHAYETEPSTTTYEYNTADELIAVTDPDKHTTKYGYNEEGDRTSMVDPNSLETKWTYDKKFDIDTETTPKGETTTYKRETHGNPEVIERPAPGSKTQKTTFKYDSKGDVISETNPLEQTRSYEYDTYGDRESETDPESHKRTWKYNEDSQETATTSPRGFETKTERDAQGRPVKVTDPLGHTTKYVYDGDGNLEKITDGNGHTTTYTYDADNERTAVKEPSGITTETEYDAAGQPIAQIDGNKHVTKYVRNHLERITEMINPLGHATSYEYDAAGNLKKVTDAEKRTTSYTYDPGNRLTEIAYSDGKTHSVTYEYDKDGSVIKMVDATGTTKYTYDQLERLTETESGNKEKAKYEYNLGNETTQITYPNGKAVTRAYNKDDEIESVTDWSSHTTKFSYSADSELTVTIFPTESKDEDKYGYNEADQMTEVKMTKSTETLASLAYERDNIGQVKKITSTGLPGEVSTEYGYDEDNRLTKAGTVGYEYDAANNPTKEGATTNTFNEADELEKGAGISYSYSEIGQRSKATPEKGPATTYEYNQAGDLTTVTRPKEGEVTAIEDSYTYDGNELRASQTIAGTTTHLAWDLAEPVPLLLSDGTNSYIYGPSGLPVEQINNSTGTVTYLHHDQQGSTRLLTGSAGTVTGKCSYSPYGTPTCEGAATTPLGFDAQYTSPDTGLIYMRARTYDPATAQFLSVDPFVALTGEPYSYASDNPLNRADPTGRCGLFCIGGIVLGGVAVVTGVGEVVAGGAIVAEGTLGAISAVSGVVGAGADLKECVGGSDISCVGAAAGGVGAVGAFGVAVGAFAGSAASGAAAIGITTGGIGFLGDAAGAAAATETVTRVQAGCG